MAETEVETILREIRERVLSGQRSGYDAQDVAAMTSAGNGAGEFSSSPHGRLGDSDSSAAGNLSLINSYLTTTARAWDRLPPVVSNRSGFIAGVELWFKRRLRTVTRWFTWEQVNFNAAVHHALRDLLPLLSAYDAELRKLREQLAASQAREEELAQGLTAQANDFQSANEMRNQQIAALTSEMREGVQRLLDEQRVCYKQLALEATEAAVLEDRARRKTETLLEELRSRVEQLETK